MRPTRYWTAENAKIRDISHKKDNLYKKFLFLQKVIILWIGIDYGKYI